MGFHLGLHLHSKVKRPKSAANGKKSENGKSSVIAELELAMFEKQTRLAIYSISDNKISAKFAILQILWILIFALGIFCIVHSSFMSIFSGRTHGNFLRRIFLSALQNILE